MLFLSKPTTSSRSGWPSAPVTSYVSPNSLIQMQTVLGGVHVEHDGDRSHAVGPRATGDRAAARDSRARPATRRRWRPRRNRHARSVPRARRESADRSADKDSGSLRRRRLEPARKRPALGQQAGVGGRKAKLVATGRAGRDPDRSADRDWAISAKPPLPVRRSPVSDAGSSRKTFVATIKKLAAATRPIDRLLRAGCRARFRRAKPPTEDGPAPIARDDQTSRHKPA